MRRHQLKQVGLVVQRAPERGLARELARAHFVRGGETRRDGGEGVGRSGTGTRRVESPGGLGARAASRRDLRFRAPPLYGVGTRIGTRIGNRGRCLGQARTLRSDRQSLALGRGVLAAAPRVGVALVAPLYRFHRCRSAQPGGRRARGGEQKRRRRRRARQVAAQEALARDASQRRQYRGGEAARRAFPRAVARLSGGEAFKC